MTNIDEQDDIDLNDVNTGEEDEEEVDVDGLKAELAKEKAEREKFEARFKRTAKQLNEFKSKTKAETDPEELFEKKFEEKMFFMNNPVAKDFENEIREIQNTSNLSVDDAYTLFLAKKQSNGAGSSSTGVEGVEKGVESKKSYHEMTEDELWAIDG